MDSRAVWLVPQLLCPVVLRRTLRGQRGDICRCSTHHIPEVTDLEYDSLILDQLCSSEQTIVIYVSSAEDKDWTKSGLAQVYRGLNRSRTMPCIQVGGTRRQQAVGKCAPRTGEAEARGSLWV